MARRNDGRRKSPTSVHPDPPGYSKKLLIATDTCRLSQLRHHGGRGYDYIWTDFLPLLRAEGIDQASIDDILIENPSRAVNIS